MAAKWLQSTANTSSSSSFLSFFTPVQLPISVMSWRAAHLISNDGGAGNVGSRLRGGAGGFATFSSLCLQTSSFHLPSSPATSPPAILSSPVRLLPILDNCLRHLKIPEAFHLQQLMPVEPTFPQPPKMLPLS